MQSHTFLLSNDNPTTKEIYFSSYHGEQYYIICSEEEFYTPLKLTLRNATGYYNTNPFYHHQTGLKLKKKTQHNFLILEKIKDSEPDTLKITIDII